jgi:hypothetical protein
MCALVIGVNLVLVFFYREPARTGGGKEPLSATLRNIFRNTVIVMRDMKFVLFLIIIIGFWTMYMQLFFTVPVYIAQWIDTGTIYERLGLLKPAIGAVEEGVGLVRPEMMINVPAFIIILFQVVISSLVKSIRPVKSMVVGFVVVAIGLGQLYFYINGWFVVLALMVLAFGEMASSPRIQEYISTIASRDKVGLYMGYSFLPVAGGNVLGGLLSGQLYGKLSDKYAFLRQYLVEKGHVAEGSLDGIDDAVLFRQTLDRLNLSASDLNDLLYTAYQPGNIWLVFAAIGLFTAAVLFLYNKFLLRETGNQ